jgi:ribosome production factor 1
MVKKKLHGSLGGKKPVNTAKASHRKTPVTRNPSHITNRLKRSEMYGKYLEQKRQEKKHARLQRIKEVKALGGDDDDRDDGGVAKKTVPKTLDNTREVEPTMVLQDPEVAADEADDEFARYFHREFPPKVLVTTRPRPSQNLFYFIADLQRLIPKLHFYPRKSFSVKEICQFAANRDFTHVIVLTENAKQCNGMTISHIGGGGGDDGDEKLVGPTAFFKVSNVVTSQNIPNHGASTNHIPELNLHGFGTRLGHRVGRLLGSLFPHDAEFQGRQVVTFHNQRDYLFVRHHRYVFEEKKNNIDQASASAAATSKSNKSSDDSSPQLEIKDRVKARLQELGPRFTLKLRWIQSGTFDTQFGEYEWIHKRKEMDTTRRRFHL